MNYGGEASENQTDTGNSMDHGGGNFRSQLPHERKWTKSHTPDLIIGDPDICWSTNQNRNSK